MKKILLSALILVAALSGTILFAQSRTSHNHDGSAIARSGRSPIMSFSKQETMREQVWTLKTNGDLDHRVNGPAPKREELSRSDHRLSEATVQKVVTELDSCPDEFFLTDKPPIMERILSPKEYDTWWSRVVTSIGIPTVEIKLRLQSGALIEQKIIGISGLANKFPANKIVQQLNSCLLNVEKSLVEAKS